MAERVHPTDSLSVPLTASSVNSDFSIPPPPQQSPPPPPGTYVIQVPKDQVYRVPPPENATRYKLYTRPNNHRCCRCRCLLLFVAVLIALFGIAAGVFFLIVRPSSPNYSVLSMAIKGINPTSLSTNNSISPEFNLTVRAENPNKKIGIYYKKNSTVRVYYSEVMLCEGALPVFYQASNNVTVMLTKLKGSGIKLPGTIHKALQDSYRQGKVLLKVDLRAPVKLKVYSVKTWTITVKVSCKISVNKLTAGSKIIEEKCDYNVKLW